MQKELVELLEDKEVLYLLRDIARFKKGTRYKR